MNKIMFNDRFNLTKLVLEGIKTHTRRLELDCNIRFYLYNYEGSYPKIEDNKICIYSDDGYLLVTRNTRYKIREEVAIAQSYSQCGNFPDYELDEDGYPVMPKRSGYFNKMFVKAELMPYRIRITNIKIERMQDISDEDCLKEGITEVSGEFEAHTVLQNGYYGERLRVIKRYYGIQYYELGESPREAYGTLIDKISGKGTWESNPYVIVYEFELIK
jgi:hypothetical protein